MVDVKKRKLQWQKNLERAKRPEDRKRQYPPVEASISPRHYEVTAELAAQLNSEIANYNRDRNALSLWSVLTICLENKIPVPDGVDKFFLHISRELIDYARDGEARARELISDLVLETVNEDGGRGAFRSFKDAEKERDIVRRTSEIVFQQIKRAFPEHGSLEAIYVIVAQEFDVEPEHVKRLVRLYEGDAGSFDLRGLFKAATSRPQAFASGLDTTRAEPEDEIHFEEPLD